MGTVFPGGLDTLSNPTPSTDQDDPGFEHDAQHANANDAIEALEAKVGINGSADTASLDYKTALVTALANLWASMGKVVNVMAPAFGAISGGGGAAINTTALNSARAAALASGGPGVVFIPPGVELEVTPGGVLGAGDVIYTGGGKITTTQTTAGALITFPAGSTNFDVVGLVFESPNDNIVAVYVKSLPSAMSSDGRIIDNRCAECTLVDTNDLTVSYAAITTHATTGNVTRDLTITGNRGVCSGAVSTKAFIFAYYLMGATITGNRARGYASGIQWWGGDANPSGNGAIANERRCGDMTIGNNKFYAMTIGGTWGSMGKDITVTGDIAEDIGDIGFDCEGGQNVFFDGCAARNCVNGGIAAFAFNRNVRFDVTVETDALNGWVAQIKNVAASHDNQSVTVKGTFTCTNGVGVFIWEVTKVATMDIELNSVAFSSFFNNQGDVKGRIVQAMDATLATAFVGVNLGANHGCVCDVDVVSVSSVAHPAGSRAISVTQGLASTTRVNFDVRGWGTTPVKWEMVGTNVASVPKAYFAGDMVDGTGIDRVESSSNSTKSIMFIEPGRMTNGLSAAASIPSAVPTTGYWNVGQRIFYGAPTASGKIGAVCVTAGAPGTWKDFGAIDA